MLRACLVLVVVSLAPVRASADVINAIAGDASWIARHGHAPTAEEDARERERVATHLAWVEDVLRRRDVSHLAPELKERRMALLDALAEYRLRARFPRNERYAGRRPRFTDDDGNVCAVGWLVEVSAGRALTDAIAARFEYAYLLEIDDPRLSAWIAQSGFTAIELAMIQPGYGSPRPTERPEPRELPRWTQAELTSALASLSPSLERCAEGHRTRTIRVRVQHDPRRGLRVRARVSPADDEVRACVEQTAQRELGRRPHNAPARAITLDRTYRLGLSLERRARQDVVRVLDQRMPSLERCMPPVRRGKRAVLRVRVAEDGSLSLASARLPIRRPRPSDLLRSIGGPTREQILACIEGVVGSARVEPPGSVVHVTHAIPWGGSFSSLALGTGGTSILGMPR